MLRYRTNYALMISHGRHHHMLPFDGSDFIADKGKVRIGIDGPEMPIRIPGVRSADVEETAR